MLQDSAIHNMIAISLGAIPGALGRYYITVWFKQILGNQFPYGTFFINVSGCFLMGFFITLISVIQDFPNDVRLLIATGFLGAYTTFSTYGFDTLILWRNRNLAATFSFWAGSIIFGVISVQLGTTLAKLISG